MSLIYREKKWTGKKLYEFWMETENNVYTVGMGRQTFADFTKETVGKRVKMGEHFWMPVSFGVVRLKEYKPISKKYTEKEFQEKLSGKFQKFCRNLEKKGVQILENDVKIYNEGEQACARGRMVLAEPIGEKKDAVKQELPQDDAKESEQQEGN